MAGVASLDGVPAAVQVIGIRLTLEDASGAGISEYEQEVFLGAWRKWSR
jgi:hypothetical protein